MSLYDEGKALIYDYTYFNRDMELTNEFNGRVERAEYISEEEQAVYNKATERVMQYNAQLAKSNTNVWQRYAEKNQQYNDSNTEYSQLPTDERSNVDAVTGRIPKMNNGQNVASGNVVSAPSGAEWYDREWRAIKAANPDWTDNQVTAKMSETIWNNNYKALMDDIAHSSSPEEREQKIREHQSELDNYKASGINVDNDEQYLRDTQGMPSVISTYVASHVEYPYSVAPGSLVGVDPPDGISIEGQNKFQAQRQDDEATAYNSIQQDVESFKQFLQKVEKDSELQREYSEKKRQERNQPVGDFMDALMFTPVGSAVEGATMSLKGLGILFKGASKAPTVTTALADEVKVLAENPWIKGPIPRGNVIDEALGNNLGRTFPTVDKLENGVLTSTKSLDVLSPTYQSESALFGRLKADINFLNVFGGGRRSGVAVKASDYTSKVFELALPEAELTAAQLNAINMAKQYASELGVGFRIVVVK